MAGRLSGNPKGLTELQRMGVGLIIGMLSMVVVGITEIERLKREIERLKRSEARLIPNNLNEGHMDRWFFLLAVLTAFDFLLYLFCSRWYKGINLEKTTEMQVQHQEDLQVVFKV
ncbi:hypothetical protein HN51_044925 [Arachis hypogaea]